MDYSAWDTQSVTVTSLDLDPQNPRLPELGHEASQREITAELIKHEAVFELARDIAKFGFYPTEVLVCIEESGDFVCQKNGERGSPKVQYIWVV